MTYFTVRLFIPLLLVISCLYFGKQLKKKKILNKTLKNFIIFFIIQCFGVFVFSYVHLEIEEKYVEFKTPEQAFKYSYPFKEIINTVKNNNCQVMMYIDHTEIKIAVSQKLESGNWSYIYPKNNDLSSIATKGNYNIHYFDKKECSFVAVSNHNLLSVDNADIRDNKGIKLQKFQGTYYDSIYSTSYTFIENEENFYLTINNEIFWLK